MKRLFILLVFFVMGFVLNTGLTEVVDYEWQYLFNKSVEEGVPWHDGKDCLRGSCRFRYIDDNNKLQWIRVLLWRPMLFERLDIK